MKKLISLAFGTALFLASATPGFAANTTSIARTGAESWNIAGNVNLRRVTVNNPQTAIVTNNVTTNTNTGHNETNKNTVVNGPVTTGDAAGTATVNTRANDSLITVNGCGCEQTNSAVIDTTGYKSKNIAVNVNAQSVEVNNNQEARIVNTITTRSNSGHNQTNMNTMVGGVSTGNADSTVTVTNVANVSTITVN